MYVCVFDSGVGFNSLYSASQMTPKLRPVGRLKVAKRIFKKITVKTSFHFFSLKTLSVIALLFNV